MQDDRAQKSLSELSASLGGADEESPFLKSGAQDGPPSAADSLVKELKKNWWMWGTAAFVVLLLGSLLLFRSSLYSSEAHGLPLLAVKEDAKEVCTVECTEEVDKLKAKAGEGKEPDDVKTKEVFDACFGKCIMQETKEIVEERKKYKKEEEEAEKEEEKEKDEETKEKKEEDEEEEKGRRRMHF